MKMTYKITGCGLNNGDYSTLLSFLKVLNMGEASQQWIYSDEENAEVVVVDFEHQEGREFIWGYEIGIHDGKVMVSVGKNPSGCQSVYSLTRPLCCDNLKKIFDQLIDTNGALVDGGVYYQDESFC